MSHYNVVQNCLMMVSLAAALDETLSAVIIINRFIINRFWVWQ